MVLTWKRLIIGSIKFYFYFSAEHDCEFDNDGWCFWKPQSGYWEIISSTIHKITGPGTDVSFGIGKSFQVKKEGRFLKLQNT